ncbi:hypothetical protein SAMN02927921_02137 [Sinomicrobium oceani]|uniref:Ankyrin repeat-containing protein n=1 Tax=Sinomicrobium oceani TaxID=1150368 RepID=A0A1K1PYM5_9FLAO|nr:hypothetical protein [Sinomicrobium oceani]SFW52547.1 hypothetical protein SAMN02927921_02137 [Sinomicrobium oceani]
MKKIFLLLFICSAFQVKAQFKYGDLSEKQKQQISSIGTVYKNALEGQTVDLTYNEFMLQITVDDTMYKLPLVDIEHISVKETNGSYFLKLHHSGGWDYKGLLHMTSQGKAETVKAELQQFLNDFEPFGDNEMYDIGLSVRLLNTSNQDPNFYDFEYKMLKLAGIRDPNNSSDAELKEKMSTLWRKFHQELECKTETHIYPKGNYLRQLARADGEDAFELVLDNYGFDPNVIDNDGCTALDYINAQISATNNYAATAIQRFKKYRALLLKYGAKTANEICGCTSC